MSWIMASGAVTLTAIGITLIAISASLAWMLRPRDGKETRVMQMPGAWIIFPLLIIACLLGGGSLIYAHIGG